MISLKNISKFIQLQNKKIEILKNISFTKNNKISLLYGKSGSGKTTLLHIIAGLDLPSDGICSVDGVDITKLNGDERARFRLENIGIIYQFFNLINNLTIYENIILPLIISNKKLDKAEVLKLAKKIGIDHVLNQFPQQCSGGELQRSSFVRALILKPKIILADEPTGNLDSTNRLKIMELIQQVSSEFNTQFLIATHDDQFKSMSQSVYNLVDGKLVE